MPNVLVDSDNEVFKADLISQIRYSAPEFKICADKDDKPDIVVIDKDFKKSEKWKEAKLPIIFLKEKEADLDISGGQIIAKPFELEKFLDALRAATSLFENSQSGCLELGAYVLYPLQKEIKDIRDNKINKLTEKEVAIIKFLYKNTNKYVSKQDLLKEVWGYADDATTHTVETHIYRLRQKVETKDDQIIETSEGGYKLKI